MYHFTIILKINNGSLTNLLQALPFQQWKTLYQKISDTPEPTQARHLAD